MSTPKCLFLTSLALAFVGTFPAPALATRTGCMGDSDCPNGTTCQETGASGCATPACPPGQTCDAQATCTSTVTYSCEPAPCSIDADCGTGMVCYAPTVESCATSGCSAGTNCWSPPSQCTQRTGPKVCTPQYDVPCTTTANCGPGFTCTPDVQTVCTASGSTGVGIASSGAGAGSPSVGVAGTGVDGGDTTLAPVPSVDDASTGCTTTTLSTAHCAINPMPCTDASECPSGWTCPPVLVPAIACALPAELADGGIETAFACDAGGEPPAQSMCEPPHYTAPDTAGAASTPSSAGAPAPAVSDSGAGSSGAGNSTAGGPAQAGSNSGDAPVAAHGANAPEAPGGCAVAPGRNVGGGLWLAGLALAALSGRRRTSAKRP